MNMEHLHVIRRPNFRHSQAGTTLIEILITVILVSIGLLGLAGLQLSSVQNPPPPIAR